MKKTILVFAVFLAASMTLAESWRGDVTITIVGKSLMFSIPNKGKGPLMFEKGAQVTFKVSSDKVPPESITIEQFEGDATNAIATRKVTQQSECTLSVYSDGYFRITRGEESNTLRYIVARDSRLVSGLSSGGILTVNSRRTYEAKQALDANGDPIPDTNVIVGMGGGPLVTTSITGSITYLFGENQGSAIRMLEEIGSLFLFTDGGTGFGLFLGMTATTDSQSSFQVGFTFHLDRREQMAISYGLNLVQSERLTRGFREGDTIPFSDLSDVTGSKWVAAPFISITYKLAG